jgi:ParB family chromosome partitioning protein
LIPGADRASEPVVVELPTERIQPNALQPRSEFGKESLTDLEASIKEHGVLQPVLVRPAGERYELIAGERRWRAASAAGLRTVPAIIRHLDDRGALEASLVENLQREDLNPIERARAYQRLLQEFQMTQEGVARRVGRSQSSVANTIRLLALPPEVLGAVEAGRISEGHARALLSMDDPHRILAVWKDIERRGLSVRTTETLARRGTISRAIKTGKAAQLQEEYIIEQKLSDSLGSPVRLLSRAGGGGEIRITFSSPSDLERLVDEIVGRRLGVR